MLFLSNVVTHNSNIASDLLKEQPTKLDCLFSLQKCYVKRPLNCWLYRRLQCIVGRICIPSSPYLNTFVLFCVYCFQKEDVSGHSCRTVSTSYCGFNDL
jgi:hypothetical protein